MKHHPHFAVGKMKTNRLSWDSAHKYRPCDSADLGSNSNPTTNKFCESR